MNVPPKPALEKTGSQFNNIKAFRMESLTMTVVKNYTIDRASMPTTVLQMGTSLIDLIDNQGRIM